MNRFLLLIILPLLGLAMDSQVATPCDAAQAQAQPVYDTNDHELTVDSLYHIMLVASGNTSGCCLSADTWWAYDCPFHAVARRCGRSEYLGEPVMSRRRMWVLATPLASQTKSSLPSTTRSANA